MEKANFSRRPVPQANMPPRTLQLRPAKAPDNSFTFGNIVAVSPYDLPPASDHRDLYILINGQFVLSARPLQGFPQGQISLSDPQRTWAQIALTDVISVQPYDPFREGGGAYLTSMDVAVSFAGRKTVEEPYDQDELANLVIRNFKHQVFAPGQQFLLDHKSIPLRLVVKTVQKGDFNLMDGGGAPAPTVSSSNARGLLTEHTTINFFKDTKNAVNLRASNRRPAANAIIQPDFKFEDMGIGGLDSEFSMIFRKAFASRIFPPGIVEKLGIQHVKGILLHGPPGTGKTLIARKIGQMLNAREPKIINGPEVLNKYVGQSEENIRKLFADAEKEYKEKGDESGLHIIIFDELDAVCKQRGSGSAGGTGVGDSVVNQLLSKLDGVDQLNNILLIGMTNRKDMIDDALMRPGRLEVHVEISLPDETGRVQILNIHTAKMKSNHLMASDVDIAELAALTKNFSGAEIAGLIKAATSFAFARHTKVGSMAGIKDDVQNMKITRQDFLNGLDEIEPAFGVSEASLQECLLGGMIHYSPVVDTILHNGNLYVEQMRHSSILNPLSVLFYGPSGSGKTALAAKTALDSQYPFIRRISPAQDMFGFNEASKIAYLTKIVSDAHKSALSVILIDNIEELIDWSPIGPRFSNAVVGVLSGLLARKPPKDRKLLVLATTSEYETLAQLNLIKKFSTKIPVPSLQSLEDLGRVLELQGSFTAQERTSALQRISGTLGAGIDSRGAGLGVGIKSVLSNIETAMQEQDRASSFAELIMDSVQERMV